ncbi:MAG TPA: hypothetical protein VI685_06820 [Candidatus Angelobacter sp.]
MKMHFSAESLRNPWKSEFTFVKLGDDLVYDCDGSQCNCPLFDENGELELLPPHKHLFVRGEQPVAGPRCYAIGFGELPDSIVEPAH